MTLKQPCFSFATAMFSFYLPKNYFDLQGACQRQVLAAGGVLAGKTPSADSTFRGRIPSGGAKPPPVRCTQC